jgi:predicted DNA-binding protein (MmcQ/YjbR family)
VSRHDPVWQAVRAFGLAYPGAHHKSPWPGHLDLAVDDKTFAYLGLDGEPFHLSVKLPRSCVEVLQLPNAKPTGYGLGKSGWVSVDWRMEDEIPLATVKAWIDESYRAQAKKGRVKALDASGRRP